MKDRVPTQVVNGAVRMEQVDENGNSLGYIYLRRADEPSEAGTPYNKNSVLTDETASALGLDVASNPTPNDAFMRVAQRIYGLDTATERLTEIEKNMLFGYVAFTASGTFTAQKAGRYRITAIGGGGDGDDGHYTSSSREYRLSGAGGSGAVAICMMIMGVNDTLDIVISSKNATISGKIQAGGGKDAVGITPGAGGTVTLLDPSLEATLYSGNSGAKGYYSSSSTHDYQTKGGDIPYTLPGQGIENEYGGLGFHALLNYGYGGNGSGAASNMYVKGRAGGSAGVVVEYLGA